MYYNKIERQKKFILRERKFSIVFACICGAMVVVWLLSMFYDFDGIWGALVFAIPIFFFVWDIITKNRLLKQLSSIEINKTINKTYDVKLFKPRVVLLNKNDAGKYSISNFYYCLVFRDHQKNEYYYFLDECKLLDSKRIKSVRERFDRNVTLQCYEGTSIIRTIDGSVYYL